MSNDFAANPEKLAKRERLIQVAGCLLMLSPFANFFLSVYFLDTVNNKWTMEGLGIIVRNGSTSHWILWCLSFLVGIFMLKGRRSSWIPVLAVLGIFIVFNFFNLKKDLARSPWRPWVLLLTNASIFALVYSQEFHQSTQPKVRKKPDPVPEPVPEVETKPELMPEPVFTPVQKSEPLPSVQVFQAEEPTKPLEVAATPAAPRFALNTWLKDKIAPLTAAKPQPTFTDYQVHVADLLNKVVEFEGHGPWARITEANLNELHMEAIGKTPKDIEKRKVEIILRDNRVLKLKMARFDGPKYIFVYRKVAKLTA